MASQWLILFTFVSFLQLAVTNPMKRSVGDGDQNDNENPDNNLVVTPDNNVNVNSEIETNSMEIDTSYYYRLQNDYSGADLALDVVNDGSNYPLKMVHGSSNTGQFWYFVHLDNNAYSLRTRFLGDKYSLDIINDGINNKPHMAETGGYTGQFWHLTRRNDETFQLHNDFTGNNRFLDVYSNTQVAYINDGNNDSTGQRWSFNKIEKITNG